MNPITKETTMELVKTGILTSFHVCLNQFSFLADENETRFFCEPVAPSNPRRRFIVQNNDF